MGKRGAASLALYIAVLGMEMSYLYLALDLLRGAGLDRASLVLILMLYPLAFLFKWLITTSPGRARRVRQPVIVSGVVAVSLVALLAVVRLVSSGDINESSAFMVVVQTGFGGAAWWLGSSVVRREISHQYLCARFQSGLLVMLALSATGGAFLPVISFFALGLLVLAAARWETSLARSPRRLQPFPSRVLVWSSLAVFVPGIVIFAVLSPQAAQALLGGLATAFSAAGRLFPAQPPQPAGSQPWDFAISCAFRPAEEGGRLPAPLPPETPAPESPGVLWAIVFIAYLAALILVVLAMRRIRMRRQGTGTGVTFVESSRTRVSPVRGLAGLFRRLRGWLWRYLWYLLSGRAFRRGIPAEGTANSVRSVYLSLLRLAARKGALREPSQTPLEFVEQLSRMFPQKEGEVALITRIYVRDRYGRQPSGEQGFRAAWQAWQRLTAGR